jgi:hypothetical protein
MLSIRSKSAICLALRPVEAKDDMDSSTKSVIRNMNPYSEKQYRFQGCHIFSNLDMRMSKGDETSPVGNDRASCARFARISKFRDI